ncbi:hypothetical protein TRFO_25548 [Tritrichomonas foetus]|uniref:DUF4042 domain-containing protein n=1 Tax=Tritrichomonas foetus TaxID=1144522 RepID=A0A1J4K613_9EUKA|nr:hypothetical protein TRFO_25548 [Tritrichomonas foetus]|eukprot:OHT06434.1 hypothetical protein TRFO_25548 [Tritrichomonas foetus]
MSKSSLRQGAEISAISLIDECIEHSEKNYQQLPDNVQKRVTSILSLFRSKSIRAETPIEIGDLIASLAELVPIQSRLFSDLCESIAALCIDREFVQFENEALETVSNIILKHLELRTFDPSPGLRALSTLLYNNTLRIVKLHERILEVAITLSSFSDDSQRRSCVLIGNLNAFSKQKLDRQIYTRSIKFLLSALSKTGTDLLSSALRSLQLLILDAPSEILDPQVLTHTISNIAFKQKPATLKYEAIMALKALANTSKKAFYAQWSLLLTKDVSLFDLLRANPRVSKATADLLTDIFRDTWKFLYIADNTSKRSAFTTLAQQIGDVIDVTFHRFMAALSAGIKIERSNDRNEKPLDGPVYNRVSKAFATFIRNCSFDNGRLQDGYIQEVIQWARRTLSNTTEEALIVMKSLLWTDIKFKPFADSFDFLHQTFINYISHENPDFSKPAAFALCRMAYAYPDEVVARYAILSPKLQEIGPIHSLPIYLRLAEKGVTDITVWLDLLQIHVPRSFEINHIKSIQRSLQCIGLAGNVFSDLPDNIQRFCLSMVLSNDGSEAAHSVGLLARSSAADISSVFLTDALLRLTSYTPPPLQPLSNVLEAFATRHRDMFEKKWVHPVVRCLQGDSSPYGPRCVGFLFAFVDGNSTAKITTDANFTTSIANQNNNETNTNNETTTNDTNNFVCSEHPQNSTNNSINNNNDGNGDYVGETEAELAKTLIDILYRDLQSEDAKMRWNAAAALSNAFSFSAVSEEAVALLVEYLESDRVAKVKIKSADALFNLQGRAQTGEKYHQMFTITLTHLLTPAHFTNLPLATHRKYDSAFRDVLTRLFFKLLDWSKASDFTALEEPLINNVDAIYEMLEAHEDAPWKQITRLYEAKFNSIPSKTLERFQDKAFPV